MNLFDSIGGPLLLVAAMAATAAGTWGFRLYAISRGIVANPNYRSLHQRPMPCGGGIVFAAVFLTAVTWLWLVGGIEKNLTSAVVVGGAAATLFGFVDDVVDIGTGVKLAIQCGLAAWMLAIFGGQPLMHLPGASHSVDLGLSLLALVWLMNLYNFMDGIDGMAASGAIFICTVAVAVLSLIGGDRNLMLVIALLAACSLGFLLFNWPPARIFMGDSGSLFLGYCFGALITKTVTEGHIGVWTWLIIFGYFAGDTTTTTVLRMFLVKRWYGAHRSNAYQNLARIRGSHLTVVRGVCLYQVLWLFPLAVLSVLVPSAAMLAALGAILPVIIWTFRYGPRLSSS